MASLNLTITRLHFPNNGTIANQIFASFYIRPFYPVNGPYALISSGVLIGTDGTILSSPPPITPIDPSQKYMIKAVNEECDFVYEQQVALYPYCPPGFQLSGDDTYCFYQITISATPPSAPENSIAVNQPDYSVWASLIYDPGFNINGTGTFTQIPYSNTFWLNGTGGYPTGTGANTSLGPLNRSGLWSSSTFLNQTIGFSVCIVAPVTGTYYVGVGSDNFASVFLDGVAVLNMNAAAIGTYLSAHGYAGVGVEAAFRFWHIYPIVIPAGTHVLELVGNNVSGVASLGAEVYNNTPAQIIAATSYGMLNLLFSTKDYIGLPIQEGNLNIGYSCPPGYALNLCGSPIVCTKTVTTPILY
jgi:hypothetical protein